MTLSDEEIKQRAASLLAAEQDDPEEWWYLSFAEQGPPMGRGFLGGLLVKARGFATALALAALRGLNPGGQANGYALPYSFWGT